MTNILINGINGKMGQEIIKASTNYKELNIVAGIDTKEEKFTLR